MISDSLRHRVEKILGCSLKEAHTVSGGSINKAAKITGANGSNYFLKWNKSAPTDMFRKEKKGLDLLISAETELNIPEVIKTGETEGGTGFILMTFIEKGSGNNESSRRFGEQLAALHRVTAEQFGLDHDNYIGRLPQSNKKHHNWIDFFIDERLEPQLQMALSDGKFRSGMRNKFDRLYDQLSDLLPDEPASLLHGDLWSGNYCYDSTGHPTIYDPAVYYGNREIEIAFTRLFGGFSGEFYQAYQNSFPMVAGFSNRKDIYNLYPLLVHTNMFGGSYARQVQSIMDQL